MGYLRLMRPANLPTAVADILAGAAISSGYFFLDQQIFWSSGFGIHLVFLVLSTVFLYAGGVVMNDVFDYEIDMIERPERALPSGLIPVRSAAIFGTLLLLIGIVFAYLVGTTSGMLAVLLVAAIIAYDSFSKNHEFIGPLNMGVCRGLNLLLGMSFLLGLQLWWYAFIPVIYIFAITLISRGEVHGNNKKHIVYAGVLYGVVISAVLVFAQIYGTTLWNIPFLLLFAIAIYYPLINAYKLNSPKNIKKAVISGVLSLILLDAAIAVGFTNVWYGLSMLLLLALSFIFSKLFAVT